MPAALRQLGAWRWAIPVHGVFVPNESQVIVATDRVASPPGGA